MCGSYYISIVHWWLTDFSNLVTASKLKYIEDVSRNGKDLLKFSSLLRQWEYLKKMCLRWWIMVEQNKRLIKMLKRKSWGEMSKGSCKRRGYCCESWRAGICPGQCVHSRKTQESPKLSPLAEFESLCKQTLRWGGVDNGLSEYWRWTTLMHISLAKTEGLIDPRHLRKSLSNH